MTDRERIRQAFTDRVASEHRKTGKRPSVIVEEWAAEEGHDRYEFQVRSLAVAMDIYILGNEMLRGRR